ncbi:MAG: hypothetical protein ACPGXY_04615 [Alphaproteobacteria bacterium]
MPWQKLGRIFAAHGQKPWMQTHASMPLAHHLEGDTFRIYFSPRDSQNQSYVGCFDIDINNPLQPFNLSDGPVLPPGSPGAFDEHGVMPSWILVEDNRPILYYIGWQRQDDVPFRLSIGKADLSSTQPTREVVMTHPCLVSTPCLLQDAGMYRMWHMIGLGWQGDNWPPYNVQLSESKDGTTWTSYSQPAIDFAYPGECAIARPSVLKEAGGYKMWYSYRGISFPYKIGYAESADGITWSRQDDTVSLHAADDPEAWDHEMVAYPYVFQHKGDKYMLYSGNGFGQGGLGIAVMR